MKSLPARIIERIQAIVGTNGLQTHGDEVTNWTKNTLDSQRHILGIVRPISQSQVVDLIQIFHQEKIKCYPTSSGKNWGYGGSTPTQDDVLILDLSRLKRIVEFNRELAYVVVEPGVTQQDLYEYLKEKKLDFMVPTTGAGPDVSLIGNAVERGFGITPTEDHFASLLSIKAVLPNGEIYRSSLQELGGDMVDPIFKWKIGPYLDGLFTQSNLGIVLQGSIGLVAKPENVTQFIVFLNDESFEDAVQSVRSIKTKLSGIVGGINLMNKRRLLSMIEEQWDRERALEEIQVIQYARKRDLPDWAIVGALYGPAELVQGAKQVIKKDCKAFSKKLIFLSRKKYEFASKVLSHLPFKKLKQMLSNAGRALEILEGTPSKVALPLAYLKNKNGLPRSGSLNPDRDNCGLIWFAPLMPLDPPIVRDFVQELTRICLFFDIDPLITLTAISPRCIDATIPILFSKDTSGDSQKAKLCYEELLSECRKMGLFPYRLDIDHMHLLGNENIPAFRLAQTLKGLVDPDNLFAPGRYIFKPRIP